MAAYLCLLCAIFARGHSGYIYPRSGTPVQHPAKVNIEKLEAVGDDLSNQYETTVSFSLPLEDYNYLKEHKAEYHNSPYNDPHAVDAAAHKFIHNNELNSSNDNSAALQKIAGQSDIGVKDLNTIQEHTSTDNGESISNDNLEDIRNKLLQAGLATHNNDVVSSDDVPIVNHIVTTFDSQHLIQNAAPQIENIYANEPVRTHNNIKEHVTRDIYFHVPPPDLEEPQLIRLPEPPKKVYKIIFIKVPAQDTLNRAQIQQALYNQIAPVEDKTLIYVLVKKPEPIPILPPPKPTPSEHEVIFVKYRNSRGSAPLPAAGELLQRPVRDEAKVLLPGLVNGGH